MFVEIAELMTSRRPKSQENYSPKLILQIVEEVLNGTPQILVLKKYHLNYGSLNNWLNKYGGERYQQIRRNAVPEDKRRRLVKALREGRMTKQEVVAHCKVSPKTVEAWLKKASKEVPEVNSFEQNAMPTSNSEQTELAAALLKIRALESLIDVAEEKFKIAIRKKPGAKQ